jgi:glutathione synthase
VDRLADALDFAYGLGLLKYAAPGRLSHAPFTLHPAPVPPSALARLEALTASANSLALRVAYDSVFLTSALEQAAAADEFTAWLLGLSREVPAASAQPLELLIARNDFFLQSAGPQTPVALRQVEFNSIAASYPGLSGLTRRLHAALWLERKSTLVANDPLTGIVDGMVSAFRRVAIPRACIVMVVQPGETNVFDQRLVDIALAAHDIPLRRLSLEQIAADGILRNGHLIVGGQPCAVAYLRAGYSPADLATPAARDGRTLLEHSDAVVVPRVALHLAGAKKVQQVLAEPGVLEKFLPPPDTEWMRATFAGLYALDTVIPSLQGDLPAWRAAMAAPDGFVLKPQREGGGNNLYDEDIPRLLGTSSARDRAGFILMERIRPVPHDAVLVRDGISNPATCVSEIGRFGVLMAQNGKIVVNQDVGYLVRTREQHLREGGVSAGFGHLSSLEVLGNG